MTSRSFIINQTTMFMTEQASINRIFVYGTLRRGQLRESQWPHPPTGVSEGFIKALLFDLGPYPAITQGNLVVVGELWSFDEDLVLPTLRVLDEIEGYVAGRRNNLYERTVVDVHPTPACDSAGPARAFAYMMESKKLPLGCQQIMPKSFSTYLQNPYCKWPQGDEPPSLTSKRPDPYPDDVA